MNKQDQVIMDFMDLISKKVLLEKFVMKANLKEFKPSEVHCIQSIGGNPDCNVTKLAESFYMTRGAISKITKKLISKGVIESYQKADNKKEIYFRLTEQGKAVYKIHEELHSVFRKRDEAVFSLVTGEQLEVMIGFAEEYNRHLDAEIKKQGLDMTNRNSFE